MERTYWLKSVGASDPELQQANDWPDSAPQELSRVHFPDKGKPSVRPGDYLVYYASGQARILGIVEVNSVPTEDSGEERWPWRCAVRPHLIIARIDRSPSLDTVSGPERNLRASVQQQSHISLSEDEYVRARSALEASFGANQGDILSTWPMFETDLTRTEAR